MSHETIPEITVGLDLGVRVSQTYEVNRAGNCIAESRLATRRAPVLRGPSALSRRPRGEHAFPVDRPGARRARPRAYCCQPECDVRVPSSPAPQRSARCGVLSPAGACRSPPPLSHSTSGCAHAAASHDSPCAGSVGANAYPVDHTRPLRRQNRGDAPPQLRRCGVRPSRAPEIPHELQSSLEPVLEIITQLTAQIRVADRQIAQLIRTQYPVATRLQQPSGVGPLTALAFVLLIEDPHRFSRSRDVGA